MQAAESAVSWLCSRWRRGDDEGASAVEYGLLVAAIAAVIIIVVFALGSFVKGAFMDTCTSFKNSNSVNSVGASNNCV